MIEKNLFVKSLMGLPLKKKITQKKQIQLLVRAQEGIQINFFFRTA